MKTFKITSAARLLGIWLLLAVFISCSKMTEKKIVITADDLMVIYENGYVRGRLNKVTCKSKEESTAQWRRDSTEIVTRLFK